MLLVEMQKFEFFEVRERLLSRISMWRTNKIYLDHKSSVDSQDMPKAFLCMWLIQLGVGWAVALLSRRAVAGRESYNKESPTTSRSNA
jgi:hypothetical protein